MIALLKKIDDLLKQRKRVIIAIDGKAGSGKTTLANYLNSLYQGNVIHCDDFFLPINKRTPSRYEEIGGNIDYERMKKQVIDNIQKDFSYQVYSCKTNSFINKIKIENSKLIIVEGTYSLHPYFKKYYDISVFLNIDEINQIKRISARKSKIDDFINKWIPLEEKYFNGFNIISTADFVFNMGGENEK